MTIYHTHHIVPKHMGGSDDPSNLVRLTIDEHAMAHLKLFEEYGKWQDLCAYKVLSYEIGQEEAVAIAKREAGRTGGYANGRRKGMKYKKRKPLKPHPYVVNPNSSPITNKLECPHCMRIIDRGNFARYHGDKCKMKQ